MAGVIFPVLDLVFRSPFICYLYIYFFSWCLILVCDVPYVQSPGIMAGYMLGSISAAKHPVSDVPCLPDLIFLLPSL